MTGRVWSLPTVVSFHPVRSVLVPVLGLVEVSILIDIAAHRGVVVATITNMAKSTDAHKRGARLITLTRRSRSELIRNLCPRNRGWKAIHAWQR